MPFGSVLGAIVLGIFGPVMATRLFASPAGPLKAMGACLGLLGLTVGVGLLMKRSWARWFGVLAAILLMWSAANAFLAAGGVFYLTVLLAAGGVAIFLIVPVTGRPLRDLAAGPIAPSWVSRVLFCGACLAGAGFLGSSAWVATPAPHEGDVALAGGQPARGAPAASPRTAVPKGSVTWLDFADGLKTAKSERKLIVADFYATWCGPCKMMEKQTLRDPRVVARLHDVVPVRVDAEETTARGGLKGADLALRYAIEAYPTIVIVDANGHEVARNTGVMGPDEFLSWIDEVIDKAGTTVARS